MLHFSEQTAETWTFLQTNGIFLEKHALSSQQITGANDFALFHENHMNQGGRKQVKNAIQPVPVGRFDFQEFGRCPFRTGRVSRLVFCFCLPSLTMQLVGSLVSSCSAPHLFSPLGTGSHTWPSTHGQIALDGGNSASVIGFQSRPILRPQKHCCKKAFRSLRIAFAKTRSLKHIFTCSRSYPLNRNDYQNNSLKAIFLILKQLCALQIFGKDPRKDFSKELQVKLVFFGQVSRFDLVVTKQGLWQRAHLRQTDSR